MFPQWIRYTVQGFLLPPPPITKILFIHIYVLNLNNLLLFKYALRLNYHKNFIYTTIIQPSLSNICVLTHYGFDYSLSKWKELYNYNVWQRKVTFNVQWSHIQVLSQQKTSGINHTCFNNDLSLHRKIKSNCMLLIYLYKH